MSETVWWIKGDKLGIGVLSSGKVTYLGSVQAVRYWGVKLGADFTTDLAEEPDLPSTYHRALLAGVLRNFAEEDDNYKMALYWREVYKEMRREAKREANTRKDGTPYDVVPQGF